MNGRTRLFISAIVIIIYAIVITELLLERDFVKSVPLIAMGFVFTGITINDYRVWRIRKALGGESSDD